MTSWPGLGSLLTYHPGWKYCPGPHGKFVIVFLPRTGSNLLAAMLDSHPDILCHHEMFNEGGVHRSLTYKNTNLDFGTHTERDRDPYEFMRKVFGFVDHKRLVGFKISPGQNDRVLLSLLLNRRIRKIVLGRRGWLHAYTSGLIAQRTQVWSIHDKAERQQAEQEKVRVDRKDFERFLRKRALFYRLVRGLLAATFQRGLFLDYEDLQDQATLQSVLTFLGVKSDVRLEARTERQNSPNLRDRIDGYAELERSFAGTRLAKYLDDPELTRR